jgi:hypothetical protein
MNNTMKKADLIEELRQLREDLNTLVKVCVNHRRLIARLEYTRTSAGWTWVPGSFGHLKGETPGAGQTGLITNPSSKFGPVAIATLAAHSLRDGGAI